MSEGQALGQVRTGRRRRAQRLERVLGTPALFATAYGNVGSSIYYALGLVAGIALGLTPLVFVIAGLIFAATAATYTEGTVRFPEAGGSSSFARHAFNELVSFGAAWAPALSGAPPRPPAGGDRFAAGRGAARRSPPATPSTSSSASGRRGRRC